MKTFDRFFKIAFIAVLIVAGFSACKKDDKTDKQSVFTFNGANYETPKAYIVSYGPNNSESADFDLYLTSSNIAVKDGNGFTGTGDGIYFDLNSSSLTELAAGTYTWSLDRGPGTIVDGEVFLTYDFDTWTGDSYSVSDGTVKITVSGTTYEIDYSLTLANSQTITGYYKGSAEQLTSAFKK